MRKNYDYLLVGAGLFNAVFAYMARRQGKRCLVIDRRRHIGGNLYCEQVEGICVHCYGPHVFHTDDRAVWDFVNTIVPFDPFILQTVAFYRGKLFNLPFNMNTFYRMWGVLTPEQAWEKIHWQVVESGIGHPCNLEEKAISLVGKDIFEILVKGYTEKQWGRPCSELPPSIIERLPVRFTFDNNYFNDRFQGIPQGGYNRLIERLLEGVECRTDCDYFYAKSYFDRLAGKVVYSGAIDEYFAFRLGRLDYRSLRFESEVLPVVNYQGNPIVNYTDVSVPYTRIVEHKHFDREKSKNENLGITVLTKEFPISAGCNGKAEPFYPVNDDRNKRLYEAYKELADGERNVLFGGRLADYKYYDMHQVVGKALSYWREFI